MQHCDPNETLGCGAGTEVWGSVLGRVTHSVPSGDSNCPSGQPIPDEPTSITLRSSWHPHTTKRTNHLNVPPPSRLEPRDYRETLVYATFCFGCCRWACSVEVSEEHLVGESLRTLSRPITLPIVLLAIASLACGGSVPTVDEDDTPPAAVPWEVVAMDAFGEPLARRMAIEPENEGETEAACSRWHLQNRGLKGWYDVDPPTIGRPVVTRLPGGGLAGYLRCAEIADHLLLDDAWGALGDAPELLTGVSADAEGIVFVGRAQDQSPTAVGRNQNTDGDWGSVPVCRPVSNDRFDGAAVVPAFDHDLDDDGRPERLFASPTCGEGLCPGGYLLTTPCSPGTARPIAHLDQIPVLSDETQWPPLTVETPFGRRSLRWDGARYVPVLTALTCEPATYADGFRADEPILDPSVSSKDGSTWRFGKRTAREGSAADLDHNGRTDLLTGDDCGTGACTQDVYVACPTPGEYAAVGSIERLLDDPIVTFGQRHLGFADVISGDVVYRFDGESYRRHTP